MTVLVYRRGSWWDLISLRPMRATVAAMAQGQTEESLLDLFRMSNHPILCYDRRQDFHVEQALMAWLPMAEPAFSPRFALLPPSHDPESLVKEMGQEALRTALATSTGPFDQFYRIWTQGASLALPAVRTGIEADLTSWIAAIPDKGLREEYRSEVRKRLGRVKAARMRGPGAIRLKGEAVERGMSLREAAILAQIVKAPLEVDPEKITQANGYSVDFGKVLSAAFDELATAESGNEVAAMMANALVAGAVEEAKRVLQANGVRSL